MTDAPPPATPLASPAAAAASTDPGKTMGIVALVLSIIGLHLVGVVVGLVALSQSKKVGNKNGFALAGVIVGAVLFVISVIVIGLMIAGGAAFFGWLTEACRDLGPGVWLVDGITYSCP